MIKVKLIHDYTKYNSKLEKEIIGYAYETPEEQMKSRPNDNFVRVKFEGITEVDIVWRGLEIIDEDYLLIKQKQKEEYFRSITNAYDIVYTVGPSGGFKSIKFKYENENNFTIESEIINKESGLEHYNYFKDINKKIKEIEIPKKEYTKRNKK